MLRLLFISDWRRLLVLWDAPKCWYSLCGDKQNWAFYLKWLQQRKANPDHIDMVYPCLPDVDHNLHCSLWTNRKRDSLIANQFWTPSSLKTPCLKGQRSTFIPLSLFRESSSFLSWCLLSRCSYRNTNFPLFFFFFVRTLFASVWLRLKKTKLCTLEKNWNNDCA